MSQRRRNHYFTATLPDGRRGKVSAFAYGKDSARSLLISLGYTGVVDFKAPVTHELNKDRIQRLARSWGITWDLTITARHAPKGKKWGSAYAKLSGGRPLHFITISPQCPDPEKTIRHELGHCIYNEALYKRVGNDFDALVVYADAERASHEYLNRPSEIFARSYEGKDGHVRLTR